MSNRKYKNNNLDELYQSRINFNKYITQILGKDAFLHEISQNSSSSSHSNDLSNQKLILQTSSKKSAEYSQYFETQKRPQQKFDHLQSHSKKNKSLQSNQNIDAFRSNPSILKFQQADKQSIQNKTQQLLKEITKIKNSSVKLSLLDELIKKTKRQQQIVLDDQFHKRQQQKIVVGSQDCKRFSHQFDQKHENLNAKYHYLKQQIEIKSKKIQQLEAKINEQKHNGSKSSISNNQAGQLDLLKKIAKIRQQEIIKLQDLARKKELDNIQLLESNTKLTMVVTMAKKLNDQFLVKFEQQFKYQNASSKINKQLKNSKLQLKNKRFKFIQNRSLQKDYY